MVTSFLVVVLLVTANDLAHTAERTLTDAENCN
jgi:hypothetical protein